MSYVVLRPRLRPHAMLPVRFPRRSLFLLAPLALLLGCGGADRGGAAAGETGGTLIIAMPAEPTTLPPVSDASQDAAVIDALFDRLAEIGPTLETFGDRGFRPRLASSWTWAHDSLSIAFTIDSLARWHDGRPVEAADVRYTFRVYTSDSLAVNNRAMLGNIDSVSVRDARTAVFWFKRRTPQQFQDATYFMYILPSHLLASIPMKDLPASPFARKPVGSGRFRFANWEAGQRVEIVSDTANPRGRAMLDRVIWSIAADFGAATVKLFAGEADFFEYIRPGDLGQIARTPSLRLVDNRALQYLFLGFNLRDPRNPAQPHPLFADAAVRRALHMAVDRAGIVRNVFDSLGAVALGPAPRALIPDTTAFTQLPHDPAHARALLDSAGWRDSDGDGIREREGRRLSFEMLVPSSSAGRRSLTVLLQEQFRAVGAEAKPLVLEVNTFSTRSDDGQFDTYMGGWSVVPGLGGTRQTWTSKGSEMWGAIATRPSMRSWTAR